MRLPFANLKVEHWNPGASMPLVLPINLICNTPDEVVHENIRVNSRAEWPWLNAHSAHDKVAVLCGSGPSLKDMIRDVIAWRLKGATIFALNGAAKFLADNGVVADYQVLLDPRPETAQLVGPARGHLVASQCAPETFDAADKEDGSVILWHLGIEPLDNFLPADAPSHVLIGGSASVGNTATCLAYAMGYRDLQLFGYDSSWRPADGDGRVKQHAFHQPMNDGDPSCIVNYRGVEYRTSLTMKLQAERFQYVAADLAEMGAKVTVRGDGLLPAIWSAPKGTMSEAEKYRAMWSFDGYRVVAPGEDRVEEFLSAVNVPLGATVVDFGCGTGRGALALKALGFNPLLVDFADNCRDQEAMSMPFCIADLSKDRLPVGDVGYCTDVMEHIPPAQVDEVIRNIMAHVPVCYFAIDFRDDICGAIIGETLHLSVHPHGWWMAKFAEMGFRVEWSSDRFGAGSFVVTH
jgi:hypothetical protein